MVGLETKVFTFGTVKDAAAFKDTKTSIARHVGTQSWRGSAVASNALERLVDPVIDAPTKPTIVEDVDIEVYKLESAIWLEEYKEHRSVLKAWEENKVRMYNLVLMQCPSELETQLKSLSTWD